MNKKLLFFLLICTIYSGNTLAQETDNLMYPIIQGYGGVHKVETSLLPKTVPKIIVDLTSVSPTMEEVNPGLDKVARLINLYGLAGLSVEQAEISVIIHGDATLLTLDDNSYFRHFGVKNPNQQLLSLLKENHVKIMVCGQSFAKKFGSDTVNEYVEVALSAITVLAEYQQNGFSVLHI